jgi:hypothetical protein
VRFSISHAAAGLKLGYILVFRMEIRKAGWKQDWEV